MLDLSYEKIDRQLDRWDSRLRLRDALVWGPRGVLAGLLVGVALAAGARFRPLLTSSEILRITGGAALFGLIAAVIWVYVRPRTVVQKARFADRQFRLRERLITAVQLRNAQIEAPATLREQQVRDAAAVLDEVDTAAALPLEISSQDGAFILLALALLAAAIILPNTQENILLQERAVEQAIAEQTAQIEQIQQEIQQNSELTAEQQAQLTQPLNDALSELGAGDLSREEALAALSEAQSELRALEAQTDQSALQEGLAEAGSSFGSSSGTSGLSEAMSEQDLGATAQQLRDLAAELPSLPAEQQQEIGRRLSEAAQTLQESNPELAEELAAAGTALQQGDTAAAQEALEAAAGQLEQGASQQAVSEAAGQAAEQLQEGRTEVAQAGQTPSGEAGQSGQQTQAGETGQPEGATGQQGQTGQSGSEGQTGESGSPSTGQLGEGETGGVGGTSEGPGSAAQVFVPPFRDLSEFEGVEVELPAECVASPADCGELLNQSPTDITEENSLVPYEQVYSEYANTAYEALEEDYVPLGMKSYIRDYFTSLEPEQ